MSKLEVKYECSFQDSGVVEPEDSDIVFHWSDFVLYQRARVVHVLIIVIVLYPMFSILQSRDWQRIPIETLNIRSAFKMISRRDLNLDIMVRLDT